MELCRRTIRMSVTSRPAARGISWMTDKARILPGITQKNDRTLVKEVDRQECLSYLGHGRVNRGPAIVAQLAIQFVQLVRQQFVQAIAVRCYLNAKHCLHFAMLICGREVGAADTVSQVVDLAE